MDPINNLPFAVSKGSPVFCRCGQNIDIVYEVKALDPSDTSTIGTYLNAKNASIRYPEWDKEKSDIEKFMKGPIVKCNRCGEEYGYRDLTRYVYLWYDVKCDYSRQTHLYEYPTLEQAFYFWYSHLDRGTGSPMIVIDSHTQKAYTELDFDMWLENKGLPLP